MSASVEWQSLEAPSLPRKGDREDEEGRVRRNPVQRAVLRLGIILLLILLLMGIAWVIPVGSHGCTVAEIARSFVTVRAIL